MLHTVTSITALLPMHKQASRSWELRSWSPLTWVVYVKDNSPLKVSRAIHLPFSMATHWPVLLLSIPIDPSSPKLNPQILLPGLHTFSYSTSAESFFLLTLLFTFGDQFLNSGDLTKALLLQGVILVTGSVRVNVLFYCDNATYNNYYGMLRELINMLPHQYETLCFACYFSVLVSLQFWGINNCTNIELLVSAKHHSSAVVDWCYLNHSREIVNRTKTVQGNIWVNIPHPWGSKFEFELHFW